MSLSPVRNAQLPSYPRWGSRLARSLRSMVVLASGSLLAGALSCSGAPLVEPEEASTATVSAAESDDPQGVEQADPAADGDTQEEPSRFTEEWVRLPVYILFEQRGFELDDDDKAMLRELHAALAHRTDVGRIRVEGYVYQDRENVEGLAMSRAEAVVDHLVQEHGMPRELFEVDDRGDGAMYSETGSPDPAYFSRVEFSALIRRER